MELYEIERLMIYFIVGQIIYWLGFLHGRIKK